jgi:predicted Zn-dependent protease
MAPAALVLTALLTAFVTATAAAQSGDAARRSQSAAATRAMSAGRFDDAARIYRELLQASPDEAGLLMNLGMALAMGGREAEAIAPLDRAVTLDRALVPAHLFLGSSYLALGQPAKAIPPLVRAVAARPGDVESRRMLAQAYVAAGRAADAVTHLRRITELAPRLPGGWYALGHGYNAIAQDALGTFEAEPDDSPWRLLLVADALMADGRLTDAFADYREALERLPSMVTIHDSIADIYERTGHPDWAVRERRGSVMAAGECARRRLLCDFRAGRHRAVLQAALAASDVESRYWRARASAHLALAAFKRLDALPDSRERREMRATVARAERRYTDAIKELKAALTFAPADPDLLDGLGTSYYLARDFELAVATLSPLVAANPEDPRLLTVTAEALMQLGRLDDALPMLQRAVRLDPTDPTPGLALGRVFIQKGNYADAIPLIEPHLPGDRDGSLHVQLARAYTGVGQRERGAALLARSEELQRQAQERSAATGQRTITPPK